MPRALTETYWRLAVLVLALLTFLLGHNALPAVVSSDAAFTSSHGVGNNSFTVMLKAGSGSVSATANGPTAMNVSWASVTNASSYRVHRCLGSGCTATSQVGTSSTTSFGDSGLSASTTYGYRVLAVFANGSVSQWSSSGYGTTSSAVVSFGYTGGEQTYVVPNGVTSLRIEAWGAQGGYSMLQGALGGYAQGPVAVTAGETLYVYVGGKGGDNDTSDPAASNGVARAGGYNGGGWSGGGTPYGYQNGGGGGGASDVRKGGNGLNQRVVVAGGGGGSADGNNPGAYGGGLEGGPRVGNGGLSGTQTVGGSAGGGGTNGTFGQGGSGISSYGGGGGGGGWYGGGGGGFYGGGGGGSSYFPVGGSTTANQRSGHGYVTITPL